MVMTKSLQLPKFNRPAFELWRLPGRDDFCKETLRA